MTNQEAFDKVCEHLAQQKCRAWREDGNGCAYLSPAGLKCAVGCLLPESSYRPDMEGVGYGNELWKERGYYIIPEVEIDLLARLQGAHDEAYDLQRLEELLQDAAREFQLNPAAIEEIQEWNG